MHTPRPASAPVPYASIDIPENSPQVEEPVLTIPHADVLVLADMHIPHQNVTMLKRAVYITRRYFPHIKDLAVIGDTFDFAELSRFPKNNLSQDFDACLEMGANVYRVLGRYFNHIFICSGNHDERVSRRLDADLTLTRLFGSAFGSNWPDCEIRISNLDYMHVGGERPWMIGHPSNYSIIGGKTPADLADIEGCNVATGHNHRAGVQVAKSGKWLGVDVGHMSDPSRHHYVRRRMTKFPKWNAGFLILSSGYPYPYYEIATNWAELGC